MIQIVFIHGGEINIPHKAWLWTRGRFHSEIKEIKNVHQFSKIIQKILSLHLKKLTRQNIIESARGSSREFMHILIPGISLGIYKSL